MHCCFMFSPLRQMDSSKSEVAPSVAEYLEKEKLCQEICKTITESVECTNNVPITSLNIRTSSLLPELNSDQDIEAILQQISDYLVTHFGENSQCTEDGISEGLSVEEILKEAESLVRASTPYFEKKLSSQISSSDPLPLVKNIKHLNSVKKLIQKNYFSKPNSKNERKDEVRVSESIAQENHTDEHDSTFNRAQNHDSNEYNVNRNNNTTKVNEPKEPLENEIHDNDNSGLISSFNNSNEEDKQYEIIRNELTLMDLQTVPPNATYTIMKDGNKLCRSMTDINAHKQEEQQNIIAELNEQIAALSTKVAEYEKMEANFKRSENLATMERQRVKLLQDEIRSQEDLIESYQEENQRLSNDVIAAKEVWKETEEQLVEKVRKLDQQLQLVTVKSSKDFEELLNKYRKAQDTIKKLDSEIKIIKEEKSQLEKINEELTVDVTRLNCEVEEYKKELQEWGKTEREKLAVLESNAVIQSKLSQANTEVTRKQTEIIRLNGEIGRLRGELEKIRLGSVVNHSTDNSCTISQLQAALAMERENCRDVSIERDSLIKEIVDLKRQIKEMESIIIKRSKSGTCITPLGDYQLTSHSENIIMDQKNKDSERQMVESKSELNITKQMLKEQQMKYENDIFELEQQIKKLQKENISLKHLLEDQPSKSRRVAAAINSAKEDAHLLATIRGLKMELNAREKDIIRLNKELDDTKKTNKRLQKERERSLNPGNKLRGSIPTSMGKDIEKSVSRPGSEVSVCSSKEYNPVMYEEDQETLIFLRTENRSLREEIKKLEQDLISLHNKRIQDLSDLQEQHEVEVARLVRDHAAKHSSSTVAHLQSQLYTQQMVIHHLKDQIKELEERLQEVSMLKAERDHLETTLIEANKKIARLHDLASPESVQYSGLLEKLDFLERRHEVREQKLQSIVRDLIAKQGQGGTCSSNCRDKLLNKNREICYYRAEMDKILDTLSEFRWN